MGQKEFGKWASAAGLPINPVEEDKVGNDYWVGLPIRQVGNATGFDGLPSAPHCLVQVKASDDMTLRAKSIKLSNWLRFRDWPLPAFVAVLLFGGDESAKEAFLVHVGEELIAKINERLWKKGEPARLHKQVLDVVWTEKDRLYAPWSTSLRHKIEEAFGGKSQTEYQKNKMSWMSAGKNERPFRISMAFGARSPELDSKLVEFGIGTRTDLPAILKRVEETHFGVSRGAIKKKLPRKIIVSIGAPIPPSGEGILRVKSEHLERELTTKFYDPRSVFPGLPKEVLRCRFVTDFFETTIGPGRQQTMTFSLPSAPVSLSHARSFGEAIDLFLSGCDLSFQKGDQTLNLGRVAATNVQPAWIRKIGSVTAAAMNIATASGISTTTQVLVSDLLDFQESIEACARLLVAPSDLRFEFWMKPELQVGDRIGRFVYACAPLGNFRVDVGGAVHGPIANVSSAQDGTSHYVVDPPAWNLLFKDVAPQTAKVSVSNYREKTQTWLAEHGCNCLNIRLTGEKM